MLPKLDPNPNVFLNVQQTEFSFDVLGRWICSTWPEVSNNGGDPFDIVVIGAGMFGGYIADKLYRRAENLGLRVLVLDAGSFLLPAHTQNLPRLGLNAPTEQVVASNAQDPGPQNLVWGHPWHSSQAFPGLAYCPGGRSLFWGGWSPRLTSADLGARPAGEASWPADVATYLSANYAAVETEMGVQPTTDYISGDLFNKLKAQFQTVLGSGQSLEEAPLAVQGQAPESGLFPFDKYSSAFLLFDAIREDIGKRWRNNIDAWRRLMLLPHTQVIGLKTVGNRVTELELRVGGVQQFLRAPLLSPDCTVILANGTIEATRLALDSLAPPAMIGGRMGSNLMAHLRSDISARIRRTAIPGLPALATALETAALLVRGATTDGHEYHMQVTASAGVASDVNLFTSVPDLDLLDAIKANQDPAWIPITLRAIGQMIGHPGAQPGDAKKSWIDLAWQNDPATNRPRAWVNLDPSDADNAAWTEMEKAAQDLLNAMAPNPADIQNLKTNRNNIGTTHHEAGTLWMGLPGQSVTDSSGKFHHLANTYVAGPALFPVIGSANPSLTATTLARKTADAIVTGYTPAPSPAFKPLFTGSRQGWQMAGGGDFLTLFGTILEARPNGLGLLWYTREVFRNFVLKVDWLSFNPTTSVPGGRADNSGVLIRFPALNASDPANDWMLASNKGYEIQIDDMGFKPDPINPNVGTNFDPLHQTGAIYALAPSSTLASKSAGQWNTFEIEATAAAIKVTLNGQLVTNYAIPANDGRNREGHIGLQCHSGNVQFQNVMIRTLP
ncbi:family 16 glycoside hydrolase [Fundidesulfovibrio terrae]|uniref:family 16 glycoside hydrolase n=1 Tax=Fundidesulfovibrio terrae TaxID=2922866 RepID=UPI001FAEA8EA|nr:family 16 glycoside hydrolase [Fundidesulfovibrio terrae]